MSVSENVTKQVCAIDHFTGKYSFLLINQFIKRENFCLKKISLVCGCCAVANSARTDLFCAVHNILKLVRYVDDQMFTQ